ncbi:hypothetical protein [Amycolatopsis taiwanensis]|nr:hypothetical protein [Amycolatopsis taiwanensis]
MPDSRETGVLAAVTGFVAAWNDGRWRIASFHNARVTDPMSWAKP